MEDRMFDHERESIYCMYVAQGYEIRETLVGLRV